MDTNTNKPGITGKEFSLNLDESWYNQQDILKLYTQRSLTTTPLYNLSSGSTNKIEIVESNDGFSWFLNNINWDDIIDPDQGQNTFKWIQNQIKYNKT